VRIYYHKLALILVDCMSLMRVAIVEPSQAETILSRYESANTHLKRYPLPMKELEQRSPTLVRG